MISHFFWFLRVFFMKGSIDCIRFWNLSVTGDDLLLALLVLDL